MTTSACCSFCLASQETVGTLVAGPGAYICDACVELCAQVIAARRAAPNEPLAPWMSAASTDEVCATLPRVAASCAQAERDLRAWVSRARDLGLTWAVIGATLGVTRQSAWERFATSP